MNDSALRAREIVEIYRTLVLRSSPGPRSTTPSLSRWARSSPWPTTPPTGFFLHAGEVLEAVGTANDVWQRINAPFHDVNNSAYVPDEYFGDLRLNEALTELFVDVYDIGSEPRRSRLGGLVDRRLRLSAGADVSAATVSSAAVPFFGPYRLWRQADDPVKLEAPPASRTCTCRRLGAATTSTSSTAATAGWATRRCSPLRGDRRQRRPRQVVLSLRHRELLNVSIDDEARAQSCSGWARAGTAQVDLDGESDVTDLVMERLEQSVA